MSVVKILKPDKDGNLKEIKRIKVPAFYSQGYEHSPKKRTSYSKRQYAKTKARRA